MRISAEIAKGSRNDLADTLTAEGFRVDMEHPGNNRCVITIGGESAKKRMLVEKLLGELNVPFEIQN